MTEEWCPVVGEPDYMISNFGRVRSLDIMVWYGPRVGYGYRKGRILKPSVDGHGYLTVRVGKLKTQKVHVLVAKAFLGPCPIGQQVRHLDGDKENPALGNLVYGTPAQNRADAYRHGTFSKEKDLLTGRKTREAKDEKYGRENWVRLGMAGVKYSTL